jgi:hypothetical protein
MGWLVDWVTSNWQGVLGDSSMIYCIVPQPPPRTQATQLNGSRVEATRAKINIGSGM